MTDFPRKAPGTLGLLWESQFLLFPLSPLGPWVSLRVGFVEWGELQEIQQVITGYRLTSGGEGGMREPSSRYYEP